MPGSRMRVSRKSFFRKESPMFDRSKLRKCIGLAVAGLVVMLLGAIAVATTAQAADKPNIIFIMGDDIGWFNVGVYNQGMMAGRTPNLDQLATGGMRFTDYYAEASCTAGRANFI